MTNSMTTHIMLDIEALGKRPGSAIIEIGAVAFCPETGKMGECFEIAIEPSAPFTADIDTLRWHYQKCSYDIYGRDGTVRCLDYKNALCKLSVWAAGLGTVEAFWSWGATYDFPLLNEAYVIAGMKAPWDREYWKMQCARTVWRLAFGDLMHGKRPHSALEDARAAVVDLLEAMEEITAKAQRAQGDAEYVDEPNETNMAMAHQVNVMADWVMKAAPMLEIASGIVVDNAVWRLEEIAGCRGLLETCPVDWGDTGRMPVPRGEEGKEMRE